MRALKARNVYGTCTCTYAGDVENLSDVCTGKQQLLFMSPEMLLRDETRRDIVQNPEVHNHLVAFIVDEAHCVKQWLASGTILHMHA